MQNIFRGLDRSRTGSVSLTTLKQAYNARNHPDVKLGKISEDEALGEFIETFEMHLGPAVKVSQADFEKYYEFVSFCIESDVTFEKHVSSVWKQPPSAPAAGAESYVAPHPVATSLAGKREPVRPLTVTQAAPFGTSELPTDYSKWGKAQAVYKPEAALAKPAGYPSGPAYEKPRAAAFEPKAPATAAGKLIGTPEKSERAVLDTVKVNLIARGPRGVFGLFRAFRISDTQGLGRIGLAEFAKVLREYRIKLTEPECDKLFAVFSVDGTVDYIDFMNAVIVRFFVNENSNKATIKNEPKMNRE